MLWFLNFFAQSKVDSVRHLGNVTASPQIFYDGCIAEKYDHATCQAGKKTLEIAVKESSCDKVCAPDFTDTPLLGDCVCGLVSGTACVGSIAGCAVACAGSFGVACLTCLSVVPT